MIHEPTFAIEEPVVPMVRCVACEQRIPRHTAHKVTITQWQDFPGYPLSGTIIVGGGVKELPLWQHSQSTYDPSITATASTFYSGAYTPPTPTHLINTYVGYACSHDHAEQGAKTHECFITSSIP